MCGRFSLTVQEDEIEKLFDVTLDRSMYVPRYNGAPGQQMLVITMQERREAQWMRWGLVPSWAADIRIGNKMINARSETVESKPAFRQAFRLRRCLVPADGFFEWKKNGKKAPYRILMKDHLAFAMAGIWEEWKDAEGHQLHTFSILTTRPNMMMQEIHDRMPVILPVQSHHTYLTSKDPEQVLPLLQPYPEELMYAYPISNKVNSPRNDDASIFQAAPPTPVSLFQDMTGE
ncbi:MAG: SOS response-associated peptidase [Lentimicrobiaceae bacterium]|nr:SOS response-associated peptidase [Lentimicrobiaceae bacterium]